MRLKVQPLNTEAFAPFGDAVTKPDSAPTAHLDFLDFWSDVARLADAGGAYGIGMITLEPRPLTQRCAERHMHTAECLLPVGGDMLVGG